MAKSLQEQMLQAGLASKQKARDVRTEKRKQRKRGKADSAQDSMRAAAAAEQREKAARDRALNDARKAQAEARALDAQRRQLVEAHAVERKAGDTAYRFDDDGRIAALYLADEQRAAIAAGRLGIARLAVEDYRLVSEAGARRLAEAHPDLLVVFHPRKADADDEDDPYAGFEVPDDLTW